MGSKKFLGSKEFFRGVYVCGFLLPFAVSNAYASWRISGFARAEYGNGKRYTENSDEDRLGITKAAVKISTKHKDLRTALVVGTKGTQDGTTRGDLNVKLAYVELGNIAESGVSVSAGLQPLLFGLKPNGFKGDRSIHAGVEFGAGGRFPVARQAGQAIIAKKEFGGFSFRGGMFKYNKATSRVLHESDASITDNYFAQIYGKNIFGSGLYGVVGYESIYIDSTTKNKPIATVGLGWKNDYFDVSAEQTTIDESISNTVGDETYNIVELAVKPLKKARLYADYSEAERAGVKTYRTGVNYNYGDHTVLTLEYSKDRYLAKSDVDSVDVRLAVSF